MDFGCFVGESVWDRFSVGGLFVVSFGGVLCLSWVYKLKVGVFVVVLVFGMFVVVD